MTVQTSLMFRDLLAAVCDAKGLTQHQLAFHANASQTAISFVGNHKRNLSPNLAREFAKVLGQTPEFWLDAYQSFFTGTISDLSPFLDKITGGFGKGQTLGVATKRLLNVDILDLFDPRNVMEECRIKGFDARRIGTACYYSRLGFVERNYLLADGQDFHDPTLPVRGKVVLEKGEQIQVRTLEEFHFPYWIEAEFQAASYLSEIGLTVDNGPTIDAGYEGRLRVSLKNQTNKKVIYDTNRNFLKLRFTVFDGAAEAPEKFNNRIDSSINDDAIIEAATAEEM